MDNAELTKLVQLTAEGNQAAFRTLSDHLGQKIFALAFRFLSGDRSSAEDVTQEVLIKLWQQAPRWEPTGSVQAWVSRLAYNACMDIHRARKNKREEIPEDLSVPETAVDSVLQNDYRKILLRAMGHLPERQQEAILLTYFHENSRRDVAQTMKTSEKAVEHLIARGLKALEKLVPSNLNGEKNVFASRSF